jgi:hypothetical protein
VEIYGLMNRLTARRRRHHDFVRLPDCWAWRRILVMHRGHIHAEIAAADATEACSARRWVGKLMACLGDRGPAIL